MEKSKAEAEEEEELEVLAQLEEEGRKVSEEIPEEEVYEKGEEEPSELEEMFPEEEYSVYYQEGGGKKTVREDCDERCLQLGYCPYYVKAPDWCGRGGE